MLLRLSLTLLLGCCSFVQKVQAESPWPERGSYQFTAWEGPSIGVCTSIPRGADEQTPILVVVPGARRNADVYRDAWHELALANGFIVLSIEASVASFPSEYEYNAGGVLTPTGQVAPERLWAFSVIEPLVDDFKKRFGSTREKFSIYGHSAGGQFVLNYLLFKPHHKVARAVVANPAFCTMINSDEAYPFGLQGAPLPPDAASRWLQSPMVILLGDRDLAPRGYPLSNGLLARAQGPHVFSRGLGCYRAALTAAAEHSIPLEWKLEIVQGVGHSNAHMASYAVKYLFEK